MQKRKLILDFDGTIIDAIQAYCDTYNHLYRNHKDFKEALWWKVEKWSMRDECPLVENPNDIFSNPLFFKHCDFLNPNTREVIEWACENFEVSVCSIGTFYNIGYKSLWIKDNLPCIKEAHFITQEECKMNKSSVDMDDAIFLDDVKSNLDSSNAETKICVGDIYDWNREWNGIRCFNWTDVKNELEKYL